MSNRALAVAIALQAEMPELLVRTGGYTTETEDVSCADGPVIVIADGIARGFAVSVYGDDSDDISGLAADVYRTISKLGGFALGDAEMQAELLLTFQRAVPLFDESDFVVGERMHFQPIEHRVALAA